MENRDVRADSTREPNWGYGGRERFENRGDRDSYWPYVAGTPGLYGFPGLLPFGGFPYPVPYPASDGGVRDFGGVRSRGGFAGRGPRGYRRSDDRMREDINEHLTRHAFIDASDVEVTVEDGIATLRGIVDNRDQKHLAEDVAAAVFGVRDVDNDLKVRHGLLAALTGEKASDRELARAAERHERDATPHERSGRTSARTRR
jgi:hypothetical protein